MSHFPPGADLLSPLLRRKSGGLHTQPNEVLEMFRFGRVEASLPRADHASGDRSRSARPSCVRPMLALQRHHRLPKGVVVLTSVLLAFHVSRRHPNSLGKQLGGNLPPSGG